MITRFAAEIATACVTAAFGLTIAIGALEFGVGWGPSGPEAGTFPLYMGLVVTAASLVIAGQSVAQRAGLTADFLSREQFRSVMGFVIPMIAFVAVAVLLGLYVATALYLFATMVFQNGYRLPAALAVSLGMPVFLYLVLEYAFSTPLLKGPLEAALGL